MISHVARVKRCATLVFFRHRLVFACCLRSEGISELICAMKYFALGWLGNQFTLTTYISEWVWGSGDWYEYQNYKMYPFLSNYIYSTIVLSTTWFRCLTYTVSSHFVFIINSRSNHYQIPHHKLFISWLLVWYRRWYILFVLTMVVYDHKHYPYCEYH